MFKNRLDAGRQLAKRLSHLQAKNIVVLGILRGGVVVGHPIAKAFGAPFHALMVRKIGFPHNLEIAAGAMGPDGKIFPTRQGMLDWSRHAKEYENIVKHERTVLNKQKKDLQIQNLPNLAGKTVLVVDDGIATGATLNAGLHWLRVQKPEKIVVAVPCGHLESIEKIRLKNEVVCLKEDPNFKAVGHYYRDFNPTTEKQVKRALLGI